MKSRYLFCVVLCLSITLSTVCGDHDADTDTDTSVQFLVQEFQSLRNRVSVLENVIDKQTETIRAQNDRLIKLEAIVKSGSFGEDDVENYSLNAIDIRSKKSRDINTRSNSTEQSQRKSLNTLEERKPNRAVRQAAVQPIAFYAYMSGHLHNPGGLHTLIFDVIKTNEGNGYHAHLGVFMVPKSGTYFFSWTMDIWFSSYHTTELVVDNQVHGAIRRRTNGDDERDSVTGNLILNVNEGDEVFVRTGDDSNHGMILSDTWGKTSFSGFRIV